MRFALLPRLLRLEGRSARAVKAPELARGNIHPLPAEPARNRQVVVTRREPNVDQRGQQGYAFEERPGPDLGLGDDAMVIFLVAPQKRIQGLA